MVRKARPITKFNVADILVVSKRSPLIGMNALK